MSRTYKREHTSNLFHNGEHGPHNTLLREFKGLYGGTVKAVRNLIDNRDYMSDRLGEFRRIMNKKDVIILKTKQTKLSMKS